MLVAETVPRETVALGLGSVIKEGPGELGEGEREGPFRPVRERGRRRPDGCGGEKKRRNGQEEKPRGLALAWMDDGRPTATGSDEPIHG